MGKWRRAYLELYRDYSPLQQEAKWLQEQVAHHKAEAEKTVAFAKRERERGDNLQRELLAREAEVARLKDEPHRVEDVLVGIEDDYKRQLADWREMYEAAMARVDELEAQVKVPAPIQRSKMPDERNGGTTVTLRIGDRTLVKRCPQCEQPLPDSPRCTSFTLTVNPFVPGGPIGEFFLKPSHDEKTDLVASLCDLWAMASSFAVQHGADIRWLLERAHYCHDLSGGVPMVWDPETNTYVTHPVFKHVNSIMDLAARVIDRIREGKPAAALTEEEAAALAKKLAEAEEQAKKEAEATP